MTSKKKFNNNNLWWLDLHILNTHITKFQYSYGSNLYTLTLHEKFYFYFFLLNRKNVNTLLFSNLDAVIVKSADNNNYYLSAQTIFFDFKFLIITKFNNYLQSITQIYPGNTWIERELREFNKTTFLNLVDTRKLLSNYNYESELSYNQFNEIINDISA